MTRLIVGFVVGVFTGLAFTRIPHYTRAVWTMNPPDTPTDYTGPKFRIWKNGVEV